jgi:ribosomal protein S6E (S10)
MKRITALVFALLFVTFAYSQTKTEIKPADLSKGVSTYITTNFPGYAVEKVFKVDNKGVMSTEVKISKGADRLALTFDKDFKLTKKEAIKPDVKATPAKDERKPLPPIKK